MSKDRDYDDEDEEALDDDEDPSDGLQGLAEIDNADEMTRVRPLSLIYSAATFHAILTEGGIAQTFLF